MKKKNLLFLIAILFIQPLYAHAETVFERVQRTGVLRCGYIAWQPFIIKDVNTGKLSGLSYDIFEAVAKNLGLKIDWSSEVIVGNQPITLDTNKVDAVCGDWPLNAASAKFVNYTIGYAYMPIYLYQKKGDKKYSSLNDINTPTISLSAMDGDISLLVAEKKFPKAKKVQIPSTADPTLINVNVATGKADMVANDPFSIGYFNQSHQDKPLVPVFNDKQPLVTLKTGASVKIGEDQLLRMLNEGIELLITSVELFEILDKHDPDKVMKRPTTPWQN